MKRMLPQIAGDPWYDYAKNRVEFEFWMGDRKVHATAVLMRTSPSDVMPKFNANWPMIGDMATRTSPNNEDVIEIVVKF
jgi:hypothetical protein